MTLHIPTVRPAPEPATPPAYEPAPTPNGREREFGTALANAMHEPSPASNEAARARRARGTRGESKATAPGVDRGAARASARANARGNEHANDRAAEGVSERSGQQAGERADDRAIARADDHSAVATPERQQSSARELDRTGSASSNDGTRVPVDGVAHDRELQADGVSAIAGTNSLDEPTGTAPFSFREVLAALQEGGDVAGLAPETRTTDAEDDAASTAPAATESELARAEQFVASTLEVAIAPLAPLALVSAAPLNATTSAATPEAPGEPTRATPALTLTARDKRPDHDARLAGIAAALARDPLGVRSETEALVPEVRQRLERVIERMESEYGYTVSVVETVRTQERQDALFAQGRTAPGPIVTWTRNSKHIDGLAADVVIDGGYTNGAGFERLARVAKEEGLRTLWPRDPGHIEMAPNAAASLASATARPSVARDGTGATPVLPFPAAAAPEGAAPTVPHVARAAFDPASARRATAPLGPLGGSTIPATAGDAPLLSLPGTTVPTLDEGSALPPLALGGAAFLTAERAAAAAAARGTANAAAHPLRDGIVSGQPNGAQQAMPSRIAGIAPVSAVASVAHVATVAPVAQVAQVATVAQVARVAGVSEPESAGATPLDTNAPATPSVLLGPTIARDGNARGSMGGDRHASGERGERRNGSDAERTDALAGVTTARSERDGSSLPLARELAARELASLDTGERGTASPVAGLTHSDATERIARVLRIQDAGSDRPLSSVLLRLDSPDGGEDRIRIDMRGRTIGATLDVADPQAADQLRQHVGELQQALQRQGLEGESMIVRTAQRTTDATTLTASAIAAERDVLRAASASASDGGGSTAKDSRNPNRAPLDREFAREGTDQQRSRQRRDGKGDTR